MERELRAALLSKEKAELFLSNLEKLRKDGAVNEMSYSSLKGEYSASLQYALIKIEHLKQELSKVAATRSRELNVYKQELANLEARFKVGQIPAPSFLKLSKGPERKVAFLEDQISHLTSLTNARHSAEISAPETSGFVSLFGRRSPTPSRLPVTSYVGYEQQPPISPAPVQAVPEPPRPPDSTTIQSLMVLPERAVPGSTVGVVAMIVNSGQEPVRHRAEFKVNDHVEAVNDVSLNPGQSEELTFMTVAGAPGDYYMSVDNATGILKVLPAS
jgi:hypothetical protein